MEFMNGTQADTPGVSIFKTSINLQKCLCKGTFLNYIQRSIKSRFDVCLCFDMLISSDFLVIHYANI